MRNPGYAESMARARKFLSIQAQDFIEEHQYDTMRQVGVSFLSIQAQDFIEEGQPHNRMRCRYIPEHSSSGLH